MAHSWVQSFDSEEEAFAAYARAFPGATTLLIDTYDTLEGARKAAAIEPPVQAVRLDSGDLASLSRGSGDPRRARSAVKILASGDLDENEIARLLAARSDRRLRRRHRADHLARRPGAFHGLQARRDRRRGRIKLSPGKKTYPMAKQVYRRRDNRGRSGATWSRAPTRRPRANLSWFPSSAAASLSPRSRPWRPFVPDAQTNSPLFPTGSRPRRHVDYPISYSDLLESDAHRLMGQGG